MRSYCPPTYRGRSVERRGPAARGPRRVSVLFLGCQFHRNFRTAGVLRDAGCPGDLPERTAAFFRGTNGLGDWDLWAGGVFPAGAWRCTGGSLRLPAGAAVRILRDDHWIFSARLAFRSVDAVDPRFPGRQVA